MRFAPYFLGLGLVFGSLACSSNPTTSTAIVRPELLAVTPVDFLGAVPCVAGTDAGVGARSYVATLIDITPDADGCVRTPLPFELPSSAPTSCLQPVTFSYVVPNHYYRAIVEAYTVEASQLTPLAVGSRLQLTADGARVASSWAATCGGYPPSPNPDAGFDAGPVCDAGPLDDGPPGVVSYTTITQTPHDCGAGLVPIAN